jgi:hypothetical protein
LGGPGFGQAIGTFKPFWSQPYIDRVSQYRQVAQGDGSVMSLALTDFSMTLATMGMVYCAFDRDDVITVFIHFDVHDPDIW